MSPGKPAMAPAPEDPADAGRQACVLPYLIERTAATMIDEIRQFVLDSLTDMNYSIDGIDDDTTLGPAISSRSHSPTSPCGWKTASG